MSSIVAVAPQLRPFADSRHIPESGPFPLLVPLRDDVRRDEAGQLYTCCFSVFSGHRPSEIVIHGFLKLLASQIAEVLQCALQGVEGELTAA